MKYFQTIIIFILVIAVAKAQKVEVIGQIKIVDGSQGVGKLLTSDSDGLGTWLYPKEIPYPTSPEYLFLSTARKCIANGGDYNDFVMFPKSFDTTAIIIGGISELNSSGGIWTRVIRNAEDRIGIECNNTIDGFEVFAIEEGIHTIDSKVVQAGREASVSNGSSINFSQTFSTPPVVFIMINYPDGQSGGTQARIINTVTNTGFSLWLNGDVDGIYWVAMEQGQYMTNKWRWYAEAVSVSGFDPDIEFPLNFFDTTPAGLGVINDTNNSGATWIRLEDINSTTSTFRMNTSTEIINVLFWQKN